MSIYSNLKGATTVYSTIVDLPLSGVPAGAQAYVSATNRLYLWNGTGWYNIALINTAPTITTSGDAEYTLALDGTSTVVTLEANDPEGIPITWNYAVTTGSLGSTATVSQSNNVFTITPSTLEADAGNFTLTFTASDGVNLATSASEFSLSFTGDWSLATQQAKVQGSNTLSADNFGSSVSLSIDGNLAIVGAYNEDTTASNSGAAYILARSGSTWTEQAILKASDAEANDWFGYNAAAISSDGNTAIVGAIGESTGGSMAGAAYIFTRSGSTWTEEAKIQAPNKGDNDYFGVAVSISSDGNTVIVGAQHEDTGNTNAGSAYIFTRSGSTWTQQAQIQPSVVVLNGKFGTSVTISDDGNTAFGTTQSLPSVPAAVYVFTRSGSTWTEEVMLRPSITAPNDSFGISISASSDGNTVIVGAYLKDIDGQPDAGAAYIFTRSGSTWTEEAMIQSSDLTQHHHFGMAVSMSNDGNTVIVGAKFEDDGTDANRDTGAAYIFTRDGSTWTEQSKLTASDPERDDNFGHSVAVSGDSLTTIIGADREDTGGATAGAAYVFVAG